MELFLIHWLALVFLPFLISLNGVGGVWKFLAFLCGCLALIGTVTIIGGIVAWILAWAFAAIAIRAPSNDDHLHEG